MSKKIYIVCTCQKDIEKSPSGKKFLSSPWNNIEKYWEILWKVYLVKNVYCQSEKRENSNHIPFSKCLFSASCLSYWMTYILKHVLKSTTKTFLVVLTWFSIIVFGKYFPALTFFGVNIAQNQTTADFFAT